MNENQMDKDQKRLGELLRAEADRTAGRSLRPLFSDRVMTRLAEDPSARMAPSFLDEQVAFLTRLFRPVLAFGLLFAVALALYNVNVASDYTDTGSITESVLGLPAISTTSVYDLDLYSSNTTTE